MIALVSYDISDSPTRTRLHRFLKEFGLNTQLSVFECELDRDGLAAVSAKAKSLIDPETDSVRIYPICSRCAAKVKVSGQGVRVLQLDYRVI